MNEIHGLSWAVQHLARLRAVSLDLLKLNTALTDITSAWPARQQLAHVCRSLDAELAAESVIPEALDLPFLYGDLQHGWGVVIHQMPAGEWLVHNELTSFTINRATLAAGAFLVKFQGEATWVAPHTPSDSILTPASRTLPLQPSNATNLS